MRKTRVLLFLFVLLGTGLFAQSESKTTMLVGNELLLQQNSSLKEQAAKVNAAYDKLRASATSSRTAGVTAATALNDACNTYIAALKNQLSSTSDASTRDAITREIAATKKVQTDYCPTTK